MESDHQPNIIGEFNALVIPEVMMRWLEERQEGEEWLKCRCCWILGIAGTSPNRKVTSHPIDDLR